MDYWLETSYCSLRNACQCSQQLGFRLEVHEDESKPNRVKVWSQVLDHAARASILVVVERADPYQSVDHNGREKVHWSPLRIKAMARFHSRGRFAASAFATGSHLRSRSDSNAVPQSSTSRAIALMLRSSAAISRPGERQSGQALLPAQSASRGGVAISTRKSLPASSRQT
jgi:hypothetical protein